jgi:RNA polymerase-binding transcription factor DksA
MRGSLENRRARSILNGEGQFLAAEARQLKKRGGRMLTDKQSRELRAVLDERSRVLREEIRQALLDTEEEHFVDLAGQVRDLEEASVADLLVDLDLSLMDMQVDELRDIDAALIRMRTGAYGECIDCGDEVALERLRAWPTAKRCHPCQERYERSHGGHATPSI